MMNLIHSTAYCFFVFVMALTGSLASAKPAEEAKHLLYYGNSFTMRNDVPRSVSRLAREAGHTPPVVVRNLGGGKHMAWHLEQTRSAAEQNIASPKVDEAQYDAVVFQGFSLEPTHAGDREAFIENMLELAELIRESRTGATTQFVLYQTWARGPGHSIYNKQFEGPKQMGQEVIDGYAEAAAALAERFGKGAVAIAPAGEAFYKLDFNRSLYGSDNYHAGPMGSLLSAMIIYRALYGGKIGDIDAGALAEARNEMRSWAKLTDEQWHMVIDTADAMEVGGPVLKTDATR